VSPTVEAGPRRRWSGEERGQRRTGDKAELGQASSSSSADSAQSNERERPAHLFLNQLCTALRSRSISSATSTRRTRTLARAHRRRESRSDPSPRSPTFACRRFACSPSPLVPLPRGAPCGALFASRIVETGRGEARCAGRAGSTRERAASRRTSRTRRARASQTCERLQQAVRNRCADTRAALA